MNWTEDQSKVIETRGQNILVSAAAGSGKTAVLVARIMGMLQDAENPADIDELLIVTFTKAAAGEMRERILKAIAAARETEPENEHLARQAALIHNAQITTIDGFCAYVVRSYGHTRGIVPGFRTAEEGEMKLLKSDVAKAVLDEAYAETADWTAGGRAGAEAGWTARAGRFATFVESFAHGKTDRVLEDILVRVYDASVSSPDPDEWLDFCMSEASMKDGGSLDDMPWMQAYLAGERDRIRMLLLLAEQNAALTERADGPASYAPMALADLEFLRGLAEAQTYRAIRKALSDYAPVMLSRAKPKPEENAAFRETFKKNREEIKDGIAKLRDETFLFDEDEALAVLQKGGISIDVLIGLVRRFAERFAREKQKRNIMDFADVEHAALRILVENGTRTAACRELAAHFREVMIDEYQDSNYLQEAILTAVSRAADGEQNYFCVGDVKQSIYSFRQARPELFMEKHRIYRAAPETGRRIDLHRNFRSRTEVVDSVNAIFSQIMREDIGGVEYDGDAVLVAGAAYPPGDGFETEIMPVIVGETDSEGERFLSDVRARAQREVEARAIGTRIRRLVGSGRIFDEKMGTYRPVEYRDIVILLRSVKGTADTFVRVLDSMRIPAYSEAKTGYFGAAEVQVVLSFLEILDNPLQDIPMAAVLRSAYVGLDAGEMAEVAAHGRRENGGAISGQIRTHQLYDDVRRYAKDGEDAALRERLAAFLEFYDDLRDSVNHTPLHELVSRVVTETGYADFAAAMPGGAQREVNLRMLVDRAAEYEKTSYVGLFNFVRYIRKLEHEDSDPGELSTISESENVVRIYSIHKSKGLEYPVVFVAGLGKKFNLMDLNATPLVHPALGIAADYVDLERRVRMPTLKKLAIRERLLRDTIGEELRVLYVALTRAKQKLILTGTVKDEETLAGKTLLMGLGEEKLPSGYILGARTYFDWILPAAERIARRDERLSRRPFLITTPVKPSELAAAETGTQLRRTAAVERLWEIRADEVYDGVTRRMIEERFSYQYPFAGRENIPVELSVSEIKRRAYEEVENEYPESAEMARLYEAPQMAPTVPEFMRGRAALSASDGAAAPGLGSAAVPTGASEDGEQAAILTSAGEDSEQAAILTGANRGTAYHRFMELLNYAVFSELLQNIRDGDKVDNRDALFSAIRAQKETFVSDGRMSADETACIRELDIAAFLESDLGRRMTEAAGRGALVREQPFVLAIEASRIDPAWPKDEDVFVQGIIDAYFREGEEIVLVDYKTDRVRDGGELARRYRVQLTAYAEALARATGRTVRQRLIWSFSLSEMIECCEFSAP